MFFFKAFYENLQDKLSQLKDAREALNALRSEHYEHKQQEALEHERQRQIQLAQKLDFMRQKKQVSSFIIKISASNLYFTVEVENNRWRVFASDSTETYIL